MRLFLHLSIISCCGKLLAFWKVKWELGDKFNKENNLFSLCCSVFINRVMFSSLFQALNVKMRGDTTSTTIQWIASICPSRQTMSSLLWGMMESAGTWSQTWLWMFCFIVPVAAKCLFPSRVLCKGSYCPCKFMFNHQFWWQTDTLKNSITHSAKHLTDMAIHDTI